ncbi:FBXW2-like protein [Mya arenaria]|uniref:FBXW2-like protein n=1 Tax=Mya arenaria TaxID=6604 RepID=A0ABY7DLS1_MYAAR|nr:F-box/WD repeat-containing protein 2-like [Mya arenaria]XP_052796988.1 F-box/WD repeat-containing protein 2-like [Mya arenaria]WAQ97838.1 FBXW2-like protein [Mya arenaria]
MEEGKMKLSHYRSPSDPGISKLQNNNQNHGGGYVVPYTDSENQFLIWLHAVSVNYLSLTHTQKIRTLDTFIGLLGSRELVYLCDVLPRLLYRDFLRLLPTEISVRILIMLDEKSLLNCCLVSKYWNQLINSFKEVWVHMARRVGARIITEPYIPIHQYKSLFIQSTTLVQHMKDSSAFKVMTLEGHRGRVMAITHNRDMLATGSDDHTVRFWDIHTGECVKLIHTHSVSFLQFDDMFVYTASYDNTAACWDIETGQLMCRYVGHISAVFCLDTRRSIDLIVTGSADKSVKLWQLSFGTLLHSLSDWHNDWVTHVKILSCSSSQDNGEPNHEDRDILEHSTLQLVSVDRQGCCFWTVRNNEQVNVSVTHTSEWCMNVQSNTYSDGVCVSTWNKRDHTQALSAYSTETVDNKCMPRHVTSVTLPPELPARQTVLGLGQKFAICVVDEGYSRAVVMDMHSNRVMFSIPVPPYRPTQNGASAALGPVDWLDGFTDSNRMGLFLALCLKDNNILVLKWKEGQG